MILERHKPHEAAAGREPPHAFRHELPGHEVFTVAYLGWSGTKNGELLAKAAATDFDAVITLDSGVAYQHNTVALPIAIVALQAPSNDIEDLRPLLSRLLETLQTLRASYPDARAVKGPLTSPARSSGKTQVIQERI